MAPALLLVLGCNPEQGLAGAKPPFDPSETSQPVDSEPEPPEEVCNGKDDDGDGEVDEGCPAKTCTEVAVAPAGSAGVDDRCVAGVEEPPADPWDVELAWELYPEAFGEGSVAVSGPLFLPPRGSGPGQILLGMYVPPASGEMTLFALAAETGAIEAETADLYQSDFMAAADVDGDGEFEVFLVDAEGSVVCMRTDGTRVWEVPALFPDWDAGTDFPWRSLPATVADLNEDGTPDLLVHGWVIDAATGAVEFEMPLTTPGSGTPAAVGDIDGDGRQEIAVQNQIRDPRLGLEWAMEDHPLHTRQAMIVQADGDPEGEIAVATYLFEVYDTDGTLLTSVALPGEVPDTLPNLPCAGDLDGDGRTEVVLPYINSLSAWELDGTPLWQEDPWPAPVENAGVACSVADLDGNGRAEVLVTGMKGFRILDGQTGAALFLDEGVKNVRYENPIVADVDGDGHSEVIAVGMNDLSGGLATLRVYRHAGAGWTPGPTAWSISDFSMGNLTEIGSTVPPAPTPYWTTYGVFRGATASPTSYRPGANLEGAITTVCDEDCVHGPVVVAVQVANSGTMDAPAGAVLELWADDVKGSRLLRSNILPEVPAATALAGFTLELEPTEVGEVGLRVEVDATFVVDECGEDDNRFVWDAWVCP